MSIGKSFTLIRFHMWVKLDYIFICICICIQNTKEWRSEETLYMTCRHVLDFYLDPADNGRVQGSQGRANFQLLNEKTYESGNYFWKNMSENDHYLSDLFIIKVEICDQSTDFMQNTQLLLSIHFIQFTFIWPYFY